MVGYSYPLEVAQTVLAAGGAAGKSTVAVLREVFDVWPRSSAADQCAVIAVPLLGAVIYRAVCFRTLSCGPSASSALPLVSPP